ncbi:MAG: GNAT family N-acetyltransferase, partial [Micromonosporaceae bacterium]
VCACYVLPRWWGTGIGGKLLAHATGSLEAAGRADITLWVLEENYRARRFYESRGFQPDGKQKILDLGAPVAEVRYQRPRLSPPPG